MPYWRHSKTRTYEKKSILNTVGTVLLLHNTKYMVSKITLEKAALLDNKANH
jgi:hypothetical protein